MLLCYSLNWKCIKYIFFSPIYAQYPIMTKWKHVFRNVLYIRIHTLLLWHSKLSSGASNFLWSSLSLQLDWSPPVANSIVWTWFWKKHTCLSKVPQLTEQSRIYTMKFKKLSVDLWDRIVVRHVSGEGYKTIARVLKVSKSKGLHH